MVGAGRHSATRERGRARRRAFSSTSALVPAVLVALSGGPALAACTTAGPDGSGDGSITCSSGAATGPVIPNAGVTGALGISLDGTAITSAGIGLSTVNGATTPASASLTSTGTVSITAATTALDFRAVSSATITDFAGTLTGTSGNGIYALGDTIQIGLAGATVSGGDEGIGLRGGTATLTATSSALSGANQAIYSAADDTTITLTGGTVSGGQGVNFAGGTAKLTATGTTFATDGAGIQVGALDTTVTLTNSSLTSAGNEYGAIMAWTNGDLTLNTTNTTVESASAGVWAVLNGTFTTTAVGGSFISTSTSGSVPWSGLTGYFSLAYVSKLTATGTTFSGQDNGIAILGMTGEVSLTGATVTSAGGDGIYMQTGGNYTPQLPDSFGKLTASGTTVTAHHTALTVTNAAADGHVEVSATNSSFTGTTAAGADLEGNDVKLTAVGSTFAGGAYGIYAEGGTLALDLGDSTATATSGTGVYAKGDTTTLTVAGTVSGTTEAIRFASGANTLELLAGYAITGNVVVDTGNGAAGKLVLGGADALGFDLAAIGTSFLGFTAFEKTGASVATLTGTTGETMAWTIDEGRLTVNGTMGGTSSVVVADTGILGGTGSIGGDVTVLSGGTLAPGNSVGTLQVGGNLTFDGSSTYAVEINPATSDLTAVTGNASLAGTLAITTAAGLTPGQAYTILTTGGTVSGSFATVTDDRPLLDLLVTYGTQDVTLTFVPTPGPWSRYATTFNQAATADAAQSLGLGNPVFNAIAVLSAPQADAAFDALSGEIYASTSTMLLQDSRFARDAVLARARAPLAEGAAPAPLGYAPLPTKAAVPGRTDGAWAKMFGSWGQWGGDGNAATLDRNIGGIFAGVDRIFADTWRLGIATGYSRSDFDVSARQSSGSADTFHLAAYGSGAWGPLGLRFGGAYGWSDIDTDRTVIFPGFSNRLSAGYSAGTAQVFGEIGYDLRTPLANFEPFAAIAYVDVSTDGFTETGGAAALTARSGSQGVTFSTLGVRLQSRLAAQIDLTGTLGWQHAFGDTTPDALLAFAGGSSPFQVLGVPIAQDAAVLEAGLAYLPAAGTRLALTYSGQLASDVHDNAVKGELALSF